MSQPAEITWFLCGRADAQADVQPFVVDSMPFTVGRQTGASLKLNYPTISGMHAEMVLQDGVLHIRDLESTNGTFVNGNPVTETVPLTVGDLIQLADVPLRVGRDAKSERRATVARVDETCDQALALFQFDRLMQNREVHTVFQPIVKTDDSTVIGFEALGRSRLYGLKMPRDLFLAASQLNLEAELSQMLRVAGVAGSSKLPGAPKLFLNTHPAELQVGDLLNSLKTLRELTPEQQIVLEIHEASVTDPQSLAELQAALAELQIELAFDDFGAGQSRLLELSDAAPRYLKFDMSLVQGIDQASTQRQHLVAALVATANQLGIETIAEGVETESEHFVCEQIGFDLGQGYFYGRPASPREHQECPRGTPVLV